MPLVQGEAMAMEKPVVATNVGGVHELLGDRGALVLAGDSKHLAQAMLELMRQAAETRASRGRVEHVPIVNHFNAAIRFPE
jgi:glycosyltransferase involved in cell wall biosynthesis